MGETGHETYPRIVQKRLNFKCCFGRNCLGRYQDQRQDIGCDLISSSTLDGVPVGLRQFCGVYTSVAADMKGYAMQIGSAKSQWQTPFDPFPKPRLHQLTDLYNPTSLRLEPLGFCFFRFLFQHGKKRRLGIFTLLNPEACAGRSHPAHPWGHHCFMDEWWLNGMSFTAELRPSRWSDGIYSWHPWLLTNAWILKKVTLALQEAGRESGGIFSLASKRAAVIHMSWRHQSVWTDPGTSSDAGLWAEGVTGCMSLTTDEANGFSFFTWKSWKCPWFFL